MLVLLIAVLVVVGGWYEGLYRPEASHIKNLKATEQTAQVALLSLETRYLDLVKSKKELPQERAALARLEQAVPNDPELDSLVKTLFSAAAKAGVQLDEIGSPAPPSFGVPAVAGTVAPTGPAELAMTVDVVGTASEVEKLYRVLDAEPRLFVINNFSLTSSAAAAATAGVGATAKAGAVSLSLDVFYASPNAATAAS
jgi:Tfp pilus assembly protein PilO